jgi:hypothetical protein
MSPLWTQVLAIHTEEEMALTSEERYVEKTEAQRNVIKEAIRNNPQLHHVS